MEHDLSDFSRIVYLCRKVYIGANENCDSELATVVGALSKVHS
jgi:hypothetical protein